MSSLRELFKIDLYAGIATAMAILWHSLWDFFTVPLRRAVLIFWMVEMSLGTARALYRREYQLKKSAHGTQRFLLWAAVLLLADQLTALGTVEAAASNLVCAKIAVVAFARVIRQLGLVFASTEVEEIGQDTHDTFNSSLKERESK